MLAFSGRIFASSFWDVTAASASEFCGDPIAHPATEDCRGNVNPLGPRACYDEGKRAAETLLFNYYRQHGLRMKVARIFNIFGPRIYPDDGWVVSNFIFQALRNDPITIYDDGKQARAFCFVGDLVVGLIRLMDFGDAVTGPVNRGNPHEIPVQGMAQRIIELTNSSSNVVHRPLPQDDPVQRCPDITLARRLLGWHPGVALDTGLRSAIGCFSEMLANTR